MTRPNAAVPAVSLYVGDIHAVDPLTKQPVELILYRDAATGAMFAVDATYVEHDAPVHSPFSGAVVSVRDEPHPEGFQVIGHPLQGETLEKIGTALRAILNGSDHDGIWVGEDGNECKKDAPGPEWRPFDEAQQTEWLESVTERSREGLKALGVLTGRDEEAVDKDVDDEGEVADETPQRASEAPRARA